MDCLKNMRTLSTPSRCRWQSRNNKRNPCWPPPGKLQCPDDHVAISDTLHHRILITDHEGRIQSIYGNGFAGFHDGAGREARFSSPQGLAFGDNGVYVADTGNHAIRHIEFTSEKVTTVAGNGTKEVLHGAEFDATEIGLRSPWALGQIGVQAIHRDGGHASDLETGPGQGKNRPLRRERPRGHRRWTANPRHFQPTQRTQHHG